MVLFAVVPVSNLPMGPDVLLKRVAACPAALM
jgi:hypothetical protein